MRLMQNEIPGRIRLRITLSIVREFRSRKSLTLFSHFLSYPETSRCNANWYYFARPASYVRTVVSHQHKSRCFREVSVLGSQAVCTQSTTESMMQISCSCISLPRRTTFTFVSVPARNIVGAVPPCQNAYRPFSFISAGVSAVSLGSTSMKHHHVFAAFTDVIIFAHSSYSAANSASKSKSSAQSTSTPAATSGGNGLLSSWRGSGMCMFERVLCNLVSWFDSSLERESLWAVQRP